MAERKESALGVAADSKVVRLERVALHHDVAGGPWWRVPRSMLRYFRTWNYNAFESVGVSIVRSERPLGVLMQAGCQADSHCQDGA